jgi:hypothetical protein
VVEEVAAALLDHPDTCARDGSGVGGTEENLPDGLPPCARRRRDVLVYCGNTLTCKETGSFKGDRSEGTPQGLNGTFYGTYN